MPLPDEERLPVLVAGGQCVERTELVTAMDLAALAASEALDQAPGLRGRIGKVSVVNMLSPAPAGAARALARRLGCTPAVTEVTTIGGNSPQWLVNRAAAAVAAGEVEAVLVAGDEAQRSVRARVAPRSSSAARTPRADRRGQDDEDGDEDGDDPDPVIGDPRSGVGPAELAAGMIAPVHLYAMFESVLAARSGREFPEHRKVLGELMAPFTAVAAANPFAWFDEARRPAELAEVSADNRLVADPYPKRMCAVMGVDQGAAVVVCSLAAARRAGVADRAVFLLSGAEATDVWFPTARPDPGSSPGIASAGTAALAASGLGIDDVDAFDLYSCFPCAVQMGAAALGIELDDRRGLTVTGGLPYFGGPGNNYTLHAVATMADRLRQRGGVGLVTGLGWYVTKHSVGLYGVEPPRRGWRAGATSAAQAVIDASATPVAEGADATATVVASTVVSGPDGAPSAAPVIAHLADGRQVAAAAAASELPALAGRNLVGRTVAVSGNPPRYHLVG